MTYARCFTAHTPRHGCSSHADALLRPATGMLPKLPPPSDRTILLGCCRHHATAKRSPRLPCRLPPSPDGKPLSVIGRLLIVDDSELLLDRVRARLQREGYDVWTTSKPLELPRHLLACDLAILDFHMPGTNGAEVLRALKLRAPTGAAPLFFLYTNDKVASHEYQRLGFDGGLINKGDDESLVQQVSVALRLSKLRNRSSRAPR
jgi:CheY-like chemotaxis protein